MNKLTKDSLFWLLIDSIQFERVKFDFRVKKYKQKDLWDDLNIVITLENFIFL